MRGSNSDGGAFFIQTYAFHYEYFLQLFFITSKFINIAFKQLIKIVFIGPQDNNLIRFSKLSQHFLSAILTHQHQIDIIHEHILVKSVFIHFIYKPNLVVI
jgi:hypothetical protein